MALIWISAAVLLLVIVPVVVALLGRVKRPVVAIEEQSQYLARTGTELVSLLDAVEALPRVRELVGQTGAGVARYGGAVDQILG